MFMGSTKDNGLANSGTVELSEAVAYRVERKVFVPLIWTPTSLYEWDGKWPCDFQYSDGRGSLGSKS